MFFLFWCKKAIFPKKWWHHEKRYSPKSVYWYQSFSISKKVDGESLVYDKVFVIKKNFSAKIQAPNTAMQICKNKGTTKKASRKTVYDKVFKVLAKKVTFIKKIVVPLKKSISHKSVHWYQCFSLWKMLDGDCLVHDKEKFCFKNPFFAKNAIFSKIMS